MEKIKLNFLHEGSVAQVILKAPKGNVLDKIMMAELGDVFNEFKSNNNLKAIILEGEGGNFSFGASVEEHKKELAGEMLKSFHGLFYSLIESGIPSIAKIEGQCLGGGLELALICNFLFAVKNARLGQPEIVLGVFPPPASIMLPLKIGSAKADELLLTGKSIDAEHGKSLGLINEVFDDTDSLNKGVDEFIIKYLLPKSATSLRYAVKAARTLFNDTIMNKLSKLESTYVHDLMETHDANEGINSFLEKRKPVWQNR